MGNLIMSRKEREQVYIFRKLANGELSRTAAAKSLGISPRWVRKKLKRFKIEGEGGLVHRTRGRPSKKRWNQEYETLSVQLLQNEYIGFGPTFAAEKLEERHGIKVSRETLRKIMKAHGLWSDKVRRSKHRQRRPRNKCLGIMVQLDGSPHDWFEGRGPWCTLIVFIDDATSRILWLEFATSESYESVMLATCHYIDKNGIPASFYVDYGGVFSVNNNNAEREKKTQFERACKEVRVRVIHASSPQAKGRVERSNQTLQDRLVKEMRLRGISTIEAANKFAQNEFLDMHNKKFAVQAEESLDAHRSAAEYVLRNIFCLKENRIVQNDFTITYKKRILQLWPQQRTIIRPKETIEVREHLDGLLSLWLRKTELNFAEISARPIRATVLPKPRPPVYYKPQQTHPWRKYPACSVRQNPGRVG